MSDVLSKVVAGLAPAFSELLAAILVGLIGLVLTRAAAWLQASGKAERLRVALLRLNDAVQTAVLEVEQTVRPVMQRALADGKVSHEEQRELKAAAMAAVQRYLGTSGAADLQALMGLSGDAFERFIAGKVEARVAEMKRPMVSFNR